MKLKKILCFAPALVMPAGFLPVVTPEAASELGFETLRIPIAMSRRMAR